MAMEHDRSAWPAELNREEEGGYTVTFSGLPGATCADTEEDALAAAADLLEEIILGEMAHNAVIPAPPAPRGRPLVRLPALTTAKLEVYRAMLEAGLNKSELAERLGWQPSQVTRLFDGRHATRLDAVEKALHALGRRLLVSSRAA
jgi:antitoxin HicB